MPKNRLKFRVLTKIFFWFKQNFLNLEKHFFYLYLKNENNIMPIGTIG